MLLDVPQQDACPPVDGPQQGSQPLSAALALPELPVKAQRFQHQALQPARPQCGHCCCWEAAAEEQKREGGKGITQGRLSKGGGQQQGTPAKATPVLGEEMHVHPDEDRMRSLLLKTLPMVSMQDSSIRNGSE